MKQIIAISVLGGMLFSACSSVGLTDKTPDQNQLDSKTLGLPAQELLEGECGVFLWAETNPRQFVYFQREDDAVAQYYNDGQQQSITTTDVTSYLSDAGKLELNYQSGLGDNIGIKGTYADEIEGGFRIMPATIRVQPSDGWEQIIPVSGVFICR